MSNEATPSVPPAAGTTTDTGGTGNIASFIDHTLLKPEAGEADVLKVCAEAAEYAFKSVCVNPIWVPDCVRLLRGSAVRVATVIGFPFGASASVIKAAETSLAGGPFAAVWCALIVRRAIAPKG